MKKTLLKLIGTLFVCIGITFAFLPGLKDYLYRCRNNILITQYIDNTKNDAYKEEWERAVKYNKESSQIITKDAFENDSSYSKDYLSLLSVNDIMGYITIPKIDVQLPIYHGTNKNVLGKGVGHLPSSSLPVGGNGTHCVLAGHTGIEAGDMFNRLDELNIGDIFYLTVLGHRLTYSVDEVNTVLPDRTDLLKRSPGKDYCTLVTCTPYGINTHRLLIRGVRVTDDKEDEIINAVKPSVNIIIYYIVCIVSACILINLTSVFIERRRK